MTGVVCSSEHLISQLAVGVGTGVLGLIVQKGLTCERHFFKANAALNWGKNLARVLRMELVQDFIFMDRTPVIHCRQDPQQREAWIGAALDLLDRLHQL